MSKPKDPRIGRTVTLRHVAGQSGVTRAMDGTTTAIVQVWQYAGGLVRFSVMVGSRKVWINPDQAQFK